MSPSKHLFQLLLLAYPRDFRLEYGSEMTLVFCDCYRDSNSRGLVTVLDLWLRVILDVIRTAPLERWETFRKVETMKNLKRDAIGLGACLAIIVVAFLLHGYARNNGAGPILMLGYALDAIVSAGVISTLIIFVLMMVAKRSTFRTALWSLLIVNGALLLISTLIGMRVDPTFNFPTIHSLARSTTACSWSSVNSPVNTRVRRKTK